ncbi:MAG: hypothetical protein IGS50_02105 [Synechococcales cyanobacterium C42_A2020_086]|jgi:hypothetical protein|nr:hypothetical protein [Synechococcales cyanobacterium C42_A2020_086]
MSTPKIIRAAQILMRQVHRGTQTVLKGLVRWLLRGLLTLGKTIGQPPFVSKAGFVLPTTVLLLLVVVLTVGAISYRTFTRSQQAITERQQQVIYNAATPAIDRAKAKIEFLFDPKKDPRGGGVPSQRQLLGMMLNDGRDLGGGFRVRPYPSPEVNPYRFPDETPLDLNGDGATDTAWRYRVDLNGDGQIDPEGPESRDGWAAYSIIFEAPRNASALRDSRNDPNRPNQGWQQRARLLQVRNAPLSNATQVNATCQRGDAGREVVPAINGDGWFPDQRNTTKVRKNFQVNAYVVPDNPTGTIATLEFQQDREATQGFKWAAWFRNDLEIYPGPQFNWNGAMHSEGNLIIGAGDIRFRGFLISSPNSCINSKDASEITVRKIEQGNAESDIPAFSGRFITGTIRDNTFAGEPRFDIQDGTQIQTLTMRPNQDSVEPNGLDPIDFALEPVALQTQDISKPRNPDVTPDTNIDGAWVAGQLNSNGQGRMRSATEVSTPYLDDSFRADNRWGPYPRWGRERKKINADGDVKIGFQIEGNLELIGNDPAPGADSENVGLDGYWERRARREGLRLIVGQRLELGDPAGWGGPGGGTGSVPISLENEPLRPWQAGCTSGRCNEERQRKTLWDNLAAVQATAVYHNATDTTPEARDFPDACLVTTVHPGTPTTLDRSATFENLAFGFDAAIPGYPNQVITDFFRGRGTNGWEFSVPPESEFRNPSSNLMTALKNLAYFAGDPKGGAPSFTPEQVGGDVHPFPSMAMWGDFSMLRRVLQELQTTSYDQLSPADKTTLHTAGCTLGMLAYNLDYLEKLDLANPALRPLLGFKDSELSAPNDPNASIGLRGRIRVLDAIINAPTAAAVTTLVNALPVDSRPPTALRNNIRNTATQMGILAWNLKGSNNPETYVRLLERWRDDAETSAAAKNQLNQEILLAQLIITKQQVARDRTFGFRGSYGDATGIGIADNLYSIAPLGDCGGLNTTGWLTEAPVPGITPPAVVASGLGGEPLGRLCSNRPRYPILYSLFPAAISDPSALPATVEDGYAGGFQSHGDISDPTQRFVARDAEDSRAPLRGFFVSENAGVIYEVVRPEQIATRPRVLSESGITLGGGGNWILPYEAGSPSVGPTPNSNQFNLIKICNQPCSQPANVATTFQLASNGTLVRIPLKDAAFYNGREMMTVRTLDLDLDLMRRSPHNGDLWLPKSGIIYAFREDAVSEANIVRPTNAIWESCDTDAELQSSICAMNTAQVSAFESTDPPLNEENLITPKPVDYYPDPDRRPYGFRLRQGASIRRDGDEGRGVSFLSYNPVYVQGNFNLHQDGNGQRLEEFTQFLNDNFSNFYTRSDLDLAFADRNQDQWRPSEVLADSVTLLSSNFCDGSIEDGFATVGRTGNVDIPNSLRGRYGCPGINRTSFLNQNRPAQAVNNTATSSKNVLWVRSNIADSFPAILRGARAPNRNPDEGESPIFIARQGQPTQWNDATGTSAFYSGTYIQTQDTKSLIDATDNTRMNMIMVSGLVPSRVGQSYGGLHNFPRFIEDWDDPGKTLHIAGAFLQLTFSTYGTAPFDQEAWEPNAPAPTTGSGGANQWIRYYGPPRRRWGYDVGLQYAPAGPVAQRFQFAEDIRSEFYSEPPANDPYIRNLCLKVRNDERDCPT